MANSLPDEISKFIELGNSILNGKSELPLSFRLRLHQQIDDISKVQHPNAGYYRRSKIAIACAYRTIDIWEKCPIVDGFGRDLLDISIKCLAGEIDLGVLKENADRFETVVHDVMYADEGNIVSSYAGFSCLSAINTVVYDYDFSIVAESERYVEPESWDSCFNSSLALAGGAIWESVILDEDARKSFWYWYLNVVIRHIWSPFQPPGAIL